MLYYLRLLKTLPIFAMISTTIELFNNFFYWQS